MVVFQLDAVKSQKKKSIVRLILFRPFPCPFWCLSIENNTTTLPSSFVGLRHDLTVKALPSLLYVIFLCPFSFCLEWNAYIKKKKTLELRNKFLCCSLNSFRQPVNCVEIKERRGLSLSSTQFATEHVEANSTLERRDVWLVAKHLTAPFKTLGKGLKRHRPTSWTRNLVFWIRSRRRRGHNMWWSDPKPHDTLHPLNIIIIVRNVNKHIKCRCLETRQVKGIVRFCELCK